MKNDLLRILEKNGLKLGRMIDSSKTHYRQIHPFNIVFFNACIFELDNGTEVWYGDIDLNDEETFYKLISTVMEYGKPFLLTSETPYRFEKQLHIGNVLDVDGMKFVKSKYGWIGGSFDLSKLSDDERDRLFSDLGLAVVTEEKTVAPDKGFDKVLFTPEKYLTEEDEYGGIDYLKSAIKLLAKFF